MREGLRSSGKLCGRSEEVEAAVSYTKANEGIDGAIQTSPDLDAEKSPKVVGSGTKDEALFSAFGDDSMEVGQRDDAEDEKHSGETDIGEGKVVEGASKTRNVEKKMTNEEVVDGKMQIVCRVLRSRTVMKVVDKMQESRVQSIGARVGKRTQENDGYEKKRLKMEREESNHSDRKGSDQADNDVMEKLNNEPKSPLKDQESNECEHRNFEMQKQDSDQSIRQEADQLDDKAGQKSAGELEQRPNDWESGGHQQEGVEVKKEQSDESAHGGCDQSNDKASRKIERKRGRPPKALKSGGSWENGFKLEKVESDGFIKETGESIGTLTKRKRGRPPKVNTDKVFRGLGQNKRGTSSQHNANGSVGNVHSGHLVWSKSKLSMLMENKAKNLNNEENEGSKTEQKAGEMGHGNSEKQAVRDKIVELLLGAGWTIEYRPRNGRNYSDAVYVNPEGRTHWSVTLAYRVLKEHYEDGGCNSETCKAGFKFTPLPDEELGILTRVVNKERCDKNKKKKKWKPEENGHKTAERVTKKKKWKQKVQKRKPNTVVYPGTKLLKGRKKLKYGDATFVSDKRTTVSVQARRRLETHERKKFALMVRNHKDSAESDTDGYVLYDGKRTVLTWMIDLGTMPPASKVQYLTCQKTQAEFEGRVTMDGIKCDCCNETFTVQEVETHAGIESYQPLENLYLETGPSLLQCLLETWHKQDKSARQGFYFVDTDGKDPSDDTCGICGEGGDLICCDGCPSTFHQGCLQIENFPSGIWHCIYCSCKFCGIVSGNTSQGNGDGVADVPPLFTCNLCEEKYHQHCFQSSDVIDHDPNGPSFCGKKCQEIYDRLQMLLGVKHELEEGFSWSLVRRFDIGSDISLSEMPRKVECNSKVAVASTIMDECFLPMVHYKSGVNLIRNIVYNLGSNFNRLNYGGFLTAILERGDEIISAASIRIHGNHLAEMPFIATRHLYRRQGMCRRLLGAIEKALSSLSIEKLVIPAISELRETWTSVFGFKPVEGLNKQKIRNINMVVFPGVDMLHKPLVGHQFTEQSVIEVEGLKTTKLKDDYTMDGTVNNFNERCLSGNDLTGSIVIRAPVADKTNDESVAVESGSLPRHGCLDDGSEITEENAHLAGCHTDTRCDDQVGVGPNNMDGRNSNTMNSTDSLFRVNEQTEQVNERQIAASGSINPPTDNATQQSVLQLNWHSISEMESKTPAVYHTGSSSAAGITLHCASGGGSSSSAPEVIVLSNQAN